MSDRKPPRAKGAGAGRRGAPPRSGASGAKRGGSSASRGGKSGSGGYGKKTAGSGGYGKSSARGSGGAKHGSDHRGSDGRAKHGSDHREGNRGGSGRFDAKKGERPRTGASGAGPRAKAGSSSFGGGKSGSKQAGGRPTRGGSERGDRSTAARRDPRGGRPDRSNSSVRREAQPRWDRSRRTEPSPHRGPQGPDRRAGGPGGRGPRDPLIEEIRASTPKAKQESAIAAFEHAREMLQRGRDGAAAEAASDAKRLAPRSGAVRELYGVALYRAGRYRDALRELQAYRRMTGRLDQNHLIADSYRGLGMPDKAVPVAVEAVRSRLRDEPRAEAAIVGASALADLGRYDEALGLLRGFPSRRDEAQPWELRVWYVAGDVLQRAGRSSEAAEEFRRVVRYDAGAFDAAERLASLTV